jgi:hypothetical protein
LLIPPPQKKEFKAQIMPILRPENVWLSIQSVGDEFLSYGPIAYVTHFFELSVIFK